MNDENLIYDEQGEGGGSPEYDDDLTPEEMERIAYATVTDPNAVTVEYRGAGDNIPWEQDGYKLIFGDDDVVVRCDRRQRDWPIVETVSVDGNGNLTLGGGKWIAAQVQIPAAKYEADEESGELTKTALRMMDVTLTLWPMQGSPWGG